MVEDVVVLVRAERLDEVELDVLGQRSDRADPQYLPAGFAGMAEAGHEFVAELNVRRVLRQIRGQSPVLRELIDSGRVGLVGGIHDTDSGTVHFFNP